MSTDSGRVVVTFARSWQAVAAVRSLGRRGLEVITADEIELTPGALSRYSIDSFTYPNPEADRDGFLDALEAGLREHRPEAGQPYVLLPVHRETYAVSEARDRLEDLVSMALPPDDRLAAVRDKGRLVELAREHEVAVPATWRPQSLEELEEILPEVELPVFVKVTSGAGGVGIRKVEEREALRDAYREVAEEAEGAPLILQQAVPGDDYCVTALCDKGQVVAELTYRNVQKLSDGSPGVIRETVAAPAAERAARRLLERLDWHGVAQLDFVWDGEEGSTPYLIEVNPRLFGGLFQAVASGVDYPWMLYRLATGQPIEPPVEVKVGLRTETPVLAFLATLKEMSDNAADFGRLEAAWRAARGRLSRGEPGEAARLLLAGLKEGLGPEARLKALRAVLEQRGETVSQLLDGEDPAAGLGLVYPLALFLRYGRLDSEVMVGVVDAASGDEGA